MTTKSDKGRPSDGLQPPQKRRGGPKHDPDVTPSERLLKLYNLLLLDAKRHYQRDLMKRFGCTDKAIHRTIATIERTLSGGITVISNLDQQGRRYYQLTYPATPDTLGVSHEEVRYLALCRDLAQPFLPPETHERLGRTLRDLVTGHAGALFGTPIGFRTKGTIDYTPHMRTLETLRTAIEAKHICALLYRPMGQKEEKTYRFAPGSIIALNGALYTQGYRLEDGSVLPERPSTFLIHRIQSATVLQEYFRFDADDFDRDVNDTEARRFGLHWHPPKDMKVRVAPSAADYVRDRTWSDKQNIEEHLDGSLTLTVSTTSEKELNAWVWSFGPLARLVTDDKPTGTQGNEQ